MVVLVLTACPVGLRGHVSRWLLEISPGVFVGKVSKRVRVRLWSQVLEYSREGRAIMVFGERNEQGLGFLTRRSDWVPIDMDGLNLVVKPSEPETPAPSGRMSNARRYRRK